MVAMPILEVRELRHGKLGNLPKVTRLEYARSGMKTEAV